MVPHRHTSEFPSCWSFLPPQLPGTLQFMSRDAECGPPLWPSQPPQTKPTRRSRELSRRVSSCPLFYLRREQAERPEAPMTPLLCRRAGEAGPRCKEEVSIPPCPPPVLPVFTWILCFPTSALPVRWCPLVEGQRPHLPTLGTHPAADCSVHSLQSLLWWTAAANPTSERAGGLG